MNRPEQLRAEQAVRTAIAADLRIPVEKLNASLRTTQVNWGDSSLGIREPGMGYAAVITPGYRISAQVDGAWYAYHTNTSGHAKLASKVPAAEARPVAAEAIRRAAKELGVPEAQVDVTGLTKRTAEVAFGIGQGAVRTTYSVDVAANGTERTFLGQLGELRGAGGRPGPFSMR